MKIDGACHCGSITYEASVDPQRVSVCNCTDCQVLSGSPFRVSVPSDPGTFRLLTGKPALYLKTAQSGKASEWIRTTDCCAAHPMAPESTYQSMGRAPSITRAGERIWWFGAFVRTTGALHVRPSFDSIALIVLSVVTSRHTRTRRSRAAS